jgi:hypothetical protein
MKRSLIALFFLLLSAGNTSADIIPQAYYSLGELAGHSTNNLPLDGSGNGRNFVNQQQGSLANLVGVGAHSLSPAHVATPADTGWWGADLTTVATDNFAFGVWARASNNTAAENGDVLTTGGGANNNYFRMSLSSSGWGVTSQGNAWTVNSTFTQNEWVHLMLIRRNGVAQFFVNGSEIGPTFNGAVQHFNAHLSVNPNFTGGAYAGDIDEVRVVTFNPARTNNEIYQFVALGIPEPSSALVLGGTLILVCSLRRRP